jgi:hypothetical protein
LKQNCAIPARRGSARRTKVAGTGDLAPKSSADRARFAFAVAGLRAA